MYVCISVWVSVNFYTSFNFWIRSKDFSETLYHNEEQKVEKNCEISQNTPVLGQMSNFSPILTENWYLKFLNWLEGLASKYAL